MIQTGRMNGYKEPKRKKRKRGQERKNGNGNGHWKRKGKSKPVFLGRYILRRRRLFDWCPVRPIPPEVWYVWVKYFANDWEVYDQEGKEVVALGTRKAMERFLESLYTPSLIKIEVEERALAI